MRKSNSKSRGQSGASSGLSLGRSGGKSAGKSFGKPQGGKPAPGGKAAGQSAGKPPQGAHPKGQAKGKSGGNGGIRGQAKATRDSLAAQAAHAEKRGMRDPRAPRDTARWVVGIHSCLETLRIRPKKIREVWIREDYLSSEQLREISELAIRHRIELKPKSPGQLDQVGTGNQGVALAAMESPELKWKSLEGDGTHVVLLLDGLEDPHNLGSILRTAWLTGVTAILIPEDRAVGLTPSVCKIASGGAEHVPVDTHSNLPSAMQQLKDLGFWIYGLSEKGTRKPWEFELPKKTAWVVGSEGSGLRVPTERPVMN